MQEVRDFQDQVFAHYRQHGRHDLPWRRPEADGSFDPYKIIVSELMLQQTQVTRVIPKFASFITRFPSWTALAEAPLGEVLVAWSGLGYNRRAKFLWQTAGVIVKTHSGAAPDSSQELCKLPGIGPNTAGAVLAYAFNKPAIFIETNIRTAYIHHFFAFQQGISDALILDKVAQTLPDNARTWYWALMDYGAYLKQAVGNLNALSKNYAKQSTFAGSRRQIRGKVLRLLAEHSVQLADLRSLIPDDRLDEVLKTLLQEGLIEHKHMYFKLPGRDI